MTTVRDNNQMAQYQGRVVVFGGTGFIGSVIVSELLSRARHVVVAARHTDRQEGSVGLPGLIRAAVDAADSHADMRFIDGRDTVVIALGLRDGSTDSMSVGTRNIIAAMKAAGAQRLVCISGLGAGESIRETPRVYRIMVRFIRKLRLLLEDHGRQEVMVRTSGLEWTIIRPSRVLSTAASGSVTLDPPPAQRAKSVSVYDLAREVADIAESTNAGGLTLTIAG